MEQSRVAASRTGRPYRRVSDERAQVIGPGAALGSAFPGDRRCSASSEHSASFVLKRNTKTNANSGFPPRGHGSGTGGPNSAFNTEVPEHSERAEKIFEPSSRICIDLLVVGPRRLVSAFLAASPLKRIGGHWSGVPIRNP